MEPHHERMRPRTNTSDSIWSSQWAKNTHCSNPSSSDEEEDNSSLDTSCSLLEEGVLSSTDSLDEEDEEEEEVYILPLEDSNSRQRRGMYSSLLSVENPTEQQPPSRGPRRWSPRRSTHRNRMIFLYCGIAIYTLVNISTLGSNPTVHQVVLPPAILDRDIAPTTLQFARKNPKVYYVRQRAQQRSSWWNVLYHTVSVYVVAAWARRRLQTEG